MLRRSPIKRAPMRQSYRDTGPDKATVELVRARAAGLCEVCSDGLRGSRGEHWDIHHRRARGMGGTSWPGANRCSNLIMICRFCHNDIESRRAHAEATGRLVPWPLDPAAVAILLNDHWKYLLDDGTASLNPPGGEA